MHQLAPPPTGSRIQVKQTAQRLHVRLPVDLTLSLWFGGYLAWAGIWLIREGIRALQTESIRTPAVWLPWGMGVGCLAVVGLLLVSQPTTYVDPPDSKGVFRLQWAVKEIVIDRHGWHLRLGVPFQPQWVHIPRSDILQFNHVDKTFWTLGRRQRQCYCILRTRQKDYMMGALLSSSEQEWLVNELSTFLSQPWQPDSTQIPQ